jgi:uncharacterized DUF497 family protein
MVVAGMGRRMPFYNFQWNDEIIAHLEEHGISPEDFERVVRNPDEIGESRTTGRPCCWGETADGRFLSCVFETIDNFTIIPVTAYETRRRRD